MPVGRSNKAKSSKRHATVSSSVKQSVKQSVNQSENRNQQLSSIDQQFMQDYETKRSTYLQKADVVDFLTEDPSIPGQEVVLISCACVKGEQKEYVVSVISNKLDMDKEVVESVIEEWTNMTDAKRAMKVRGVFAKDEHENIDNRARLLREVEPEVHTFLGEVGKWGPFDPDPDRIGKEDFYEKELNTLMSGLKTERVKAQVHHEQRKRDLMQKAIWEGTKQGQEFLSAQKEPLEAIEERIKGADEIIDQLRSKIEETENIKRIAQEKLDRRSQEDTENAPYPTKEELEELTKDTKKEEHLQKLSELREIENERKTTLTSTDKVDPELLKKLKEVEENVSMSEENVSDVNIEISKKEKDDLTVSEVDARVMNTLANGPVKELGEPLIVPSEQRKEFYSDPDTNEHGYKTVPEDHPLYHVEMAKKQAKN